MAESDFSTEDARRAAPMRGLAGGSRGPCNSVLAADPEIGGRGQLGEKN